MSQNPPPIPKGVIAYITVSDAEAAIGFYRKAFGARELYRQTHEPSGKVLHASLDINGGRLMLSDDFPELNGGKRSTPAAFGGSCVTLHMRVDNVDATVVTAVEQGATMEMPVADMFWGDRFGKIRDPFGHIWSIATPIEELKALDRDNDIPPPLA